jgi:hypothetical protein
LTETAGAIVGRSQWGRRPALNVWPVSALWRRQTSDRWMRESGGLRANQSKRLEHLVERLSERLV